MMACGVAHGDLQHGNVLVTREGELRLIDFDGVLLFDPASGAHLTAPPTEVGHPNYQHPQRIEDGHVSRFVDTFSALLVHTSLRALVTDPGLWAFHRGENLVLEQRDLFEPESSDVADAHARLRRCARRAGCGPARTVVPDRSAGEPDAARRARCGGQRCDGRRSHGGRCVPEPCCGAGGGGESIDTDGRLDGRRTPGDRG
jgi:hypothetical protein